MCNTSFKQRWSTNQDTNIKTNNHLSLKITEHKNNTTHWNLSRNHGEDKSLNWVPSLPLFINGYQTAIHISTNNKNNKNRLNRFTSTQNDRM